MGAIASQQGSAAGGTPCAPAPGSPGSTSDIFNFRAPRSSLLASHLPFLNGVTRASNSVSLYLWWVSPSPGVFSLELESESGSL